MPLLSSTLSLSPKEEKRTKQMKGAVLVTADRKMAEVSKKLGVKVVLLE